MSAFLFKTQFINVPKQREEPGEGTENKEKYFLLIFNASGTITEQDIQEGEIFTVSKLEKLYVDLTPLGDMNPMAQ